VRRALRGLHVAHVGAQKEEVAEVFGPYRRSSVAARSSGLGWTDAGSFWSAAGGNGAERTVRTGALPLSVSRTPPWYGAIPVAVAGQWTDADGVPGKGPQRAPDPDERRDAAPSGSAAAAAPGWAGGIGGEPRWAESSTCRSPGR
jgi:hypothetical protein